MQIKQVVVTGQNQVELLDLTLDESKLGPEDVLIETETTFISAGTELANYTGLDADVFKPGKWCTYPWKSGYANVGIVRRAGERVDRAKVGQRVFTFGPHASAHIYSTQGMTALVPEALSSVHAAASRMAGVAITSVHVADKRPHRWVAVFGLGMVGNLAAQMFRIGGARVVGIDPAKHRRELAKACGIPQAVGGTPEDVPASLRDITGGHMVDTVVDAVGDSRVVAECAEVAATGGEVILLGTPRALVQADLTATLNHVHRRWVTLIGALEWRLPTYPRVAQEDSHWGKQHMIFDLIQRGQLQVAPLISHLLKPAQIKEAYEGLLRKKDEYTGVALDWRSAT